jgi:hypothetical protein
VNSLDNESVYKSVFEQIGFMNTGSADVWHKILEGQ